MPKLENFSNRIRINGNTYAKNTLNYQVTNEDTFSLYFSNDRDQRIITGTIGRFDDWTDLNDNPYTSFALLQTDLDLFLFSSVTDPLEISIGNIPDKFPINIFGRATEGVQATPTDIWDRADAAATQQIWLAPTAARIHTIASTSIEDNTGGDGVDTVLVLYLPDWDTKQKSETVTGNLNAGIAMSNAAVMINQMYVIAQASTLDNNVGVITATAAVDATITAQINTNEGQTQMAILGIPSTQKLLIGDYYCTLNKAPGVASSINFSLLVNINPELNIINFLPENVRGVQSTGSSSEIWNFDPPLTIEGPAIIKIQGVASAADIEGSAGFNGVLADIL